MMDDRSRTQQNISLENLWPVPHQMPPIPEDPSSPGRYKNQETAPLLQWQSSESESEENSAEPVDNTCATSETISLFASAIYYVY